jgi:DNA modification methylase
LIACARQHRIGIGIEQDPTFCQIAINRWLNLHQTHDVIQE